MKKNDTRPDPARQRSRPSLASPCGHATCVRTRPLRERKPALNVVGTKVTVLASGADIQDQQITVQSGDEGTGPPPHSHDWDESFYVTRGQIQFMCGGESAMCVAGTFVHVPAGTVHAFGYGPGGGEMLEITGKGSNAVPMFTALDQEIPPGRPDVEKVIQVLGENGVEVHM